MASDARGIEITLSGPAYIICLAKLNDRNFVRLGLHRGRYVVNTNACFFDGTLHDCPVKLWAVRIVARFAIGIRRQCEVWRQSPLRK